MLPKEGEEDMPIKEIIVTVVSSSVFLIPVFGAMYLLRFLELRQLGAYYLFAVYLCVVYRLTGPPDITYFRWDPDVSYIPFISMVGDLRSTVLNVALFLPLGIGLPFLWKWYEKFGRTVRFGFLVSLGIEVAQLFTYRATDVNDLITNVAGTALGYLMFKTLLPKGHEKKMNDAPMLLGISCGVMFFAEPFLHGILYDMVK